MAARVGGTSVSLARIGAVALGVLLLIFQIIRTAAVADRERLPGLAQALWPSHPAVLTDRVLLQIAEDAAHGEDVSATTRADIANIAHKAPMSPDPFVVEGAIAATQGKETAAGRLFREARARDPRSRAARYLLAERYLRDGRITDGLIELHVLFSLQSSGLEGFVPALVAFAKTPGAVPAMRRFFARRPGTEPTILSLLSGDPKNADLILSLASNIRNPEPDWRGALLTGLAATGETQKAYAAWQRMSGVSGRPLLFNGTFAKSAAPPPFNWYFPGRSEAAVEQAQKGGLDVLYYGRTDSILASQLLLLAPGRYRLVARIERGEGDRAHIGWALRCLPSQTPLGQIRFSAGEASGSFVVPSDCKAQQLDLVGFAGDVPETSQLTLRNATLERETTP